MIAASEQLRTGRECQAHLYHVGAKGQAGVRRLALQSHSPRRSGRACDRGRSLTLQAWVPRVRNKGHQDAFCPYSLSLEEFKLRWYLYKECGSFLRKGLGTHLSSLLDQAPCLIW